MCHHWFPRDWFVDVVWPSCDFDCKGNCRFEFVGVVCAGKIDGESCRVVDADLCIAGGVDGNVNDEFSSDRKRYVVPEIFTSWDVSLDCSM